jgi:acyl-CoA thioester hydrolase
MPKEFLMKRRVQFAESDLAGVLHFSNYFRLMEEVECAFWRSLGMSTHTHEGSKYVTWPRASVSCEYFAPVRFEDEVELRLRVTNVGEKSVSYEVEFQCAGRRTAHGRMTAVCCAWGNGDTSFEPIPIPEPARSKLAAMVSDQA